MRTFISTLATLLVAFPNGTVVPKGSAKETELPKANDLRRLALLRQKMLDQDLEFMVSVDEHATPTDENLDLLGVVDFGNRKRLLALDEHNYTNDEVMAFDQVVEQGLTHGNRTSMVMNAYLAKMAKQQMTTYFTQKTGDEIEVSEVTSRIHGAEIIDDKKIVIKVDGWAHVLTTEELVSYLMGEQSLVGFEGKWIGKQAKLCYVANHIAYIDAGIAQIYDLEFNLVASYDIGENRYFKAAIDEDGKVIWDTVSVFRLIDGGCTVESEARKPAKDTFRDDASFYGAFSQPKQAAAGGK